MRLTEHFRSEEFACPCCGLQAVKPDFYESLEEARCLAGVPFKINSGVRCEDHNADVGGVDSSSHVRGYAADIHVTRSSDRFKIKRALLDAGFTRIGTAKTFIHVDCDPSKPEEVEWVY